MNDKDLNILKTKLLIKIELVRTHLEVKDPDLNRVHKLLDELEWLVTYSINQEKVVD